MGLVRAATLADVPDGGAIAVEVEGVELALVRDGDAVQWIAVRAEVGPDGREQRAGLVGPAGLAELHGLGHAGRGRIGCGHGRHGRALC